MLIDGYGYVINGKATYVDIAEKLRNGKSVIICWSDELGTVSNILFSFGAYHQKEPIKNPLNGMHANVNGEDLLFVSVEFAGGAGFHGFTVNNAITSDNYIAEKLKLNNNITTERLAVLINNIKFTLYNMLIDPTAYEFDFKFNKEEIDE